MGNAVLLEEFLDLDLLLLLERVAKAVQCIEVIVKILVPVNKLVLESHALIGHLLLRRLATGMLVDLHVGGPRLVIVQASSTALLEWLGLRDAVVLQELAYLHLLVHHVRVLLGDLWVNKDAALGPGLLLGFPLSQIFL